MQHECNTDSLIQAPSSSLTHLLATCTSIAVPPAPSLLIPSWNPPTPLPLYSPTALPPLLLSIKIAVSGHLLICVAAFLCFLWLNISSLQNYSEPNTRPPPKNRCCHFDLKVFYLIFTIAFLCPDYWRMLGCGTAKEKQMHVLNASEQKRGYANLPLMFREGDKSIRGKKGTCRFHMENILQMSHRSRFAA